MVLARKSHHHRRALEILQRAEEVFAAGGRRRPVVLVAEDEHQRRLNLRHVSDRRAPREVRRILERRLAEPGRREEREVGRVPEVRPVGDVTLADGGLEAVRLRHDPVRQQAAAAAAGDAHPRLVDVALLQDLVDARHQILVVVARVVVLNDVAEVLAVVRAAARVRVEDDVAFGGHPLELVREGVAVGRVRAAVDLEDQRVLLRRVERRRLEDPALDLLAVEARVPHLLRLVHRELTEEAVVERRQLLRRRGGRACRGRADRRRPSASRGRRRSSARAASAVYDITSLVA